VMLDIVSRCFKKRSHSDYWRTKLKQMVPSFGLAISKDEKLLTETRQRTSAILGLDK
jgi:malate dehydrogenase (quinone)